MIIKCSPRYNSQWKNIEMVRLQTQSIIQALFESIGCIPREPVYQVKPENGACRVKQRYLFSVFNGVDCSVYIGEDFVSSALKSNLEAAVNPGKELGDFTVDELCSYFKSEMNKRSSFKNHAQNFFCTLNVAVKSRVQYKYLGYFFFFKEVQFSPDTF